MDLIFSSKTGYLGDVLFGLVTTDESDVLYAASAIRSMKVVEGSTNQRNVLQHLRQGKVAEDDKHDLNWKIGDLTRCARWWHFRDGDEIPLLRSRGQKRKNTDHQSASLLCQANFLSNY